MKFIADDGKIFDTMEECEEYEKVLGEGKEVAVLWHDFITMYDNDGKVIRSTFNYDKETHNYLNHTNDICLNEAFFIRIDCSAYDWEKITNYFSNEYGAYLPSYEKDIFRYDTSNDEWVSFHEEYTNFKEKWASVGVRF